MALIVVVAVQSLLSSYLLFKAKETCKFNPRSIYEVGILTFGRSSIFWLHAVSFATSFLKVVICFSVVASTMAHVNKNFLWIDETSSFADIKLCYISVFAMLMMPFLINKELSEPRGVSTFFFGLVMLFMFTLFSSVII